MTLIAALLGMPGVALLTWTATTYAASRRYGYVGKHRATW